MPTQREILQRREELEATGAEAARRAREAYEAAVGAEMRNLRETCGGIGHLFAKSGSLIFSAGRRFCVFCGEAEA